MLDKNQLDQNYIGLGKTWSKNHGTKIIFTKIAWEQIVCGLKEFGQKSIGQKLLDEVGHALKCFGQEVVGRTLL